MKIEVYGPGCPRCIQTADKIKKIIDDNNFDAELVKVTDMKTILDKGILTTPAVFINDEKVFAGRIPDTDTIVSWFNK